MEQGQYWRFHDQLNSVIAHPPTYQETCATLGEPICVVWPPLTRLTMAPETSQRSWRPHRRIDGDPLEPPEKRGKGAIHPRHSRGGKKVATNVLYPPVTEIHGRSLIVRNPPGVFIQYQRTVGSKEIMAGYLELNVTEELRSDGPRPYRKPPRQLVGVVQARLRDSGKGCGLPRSLDRTETGLDVTRCQTSAVIHLPEWKVKGERVAWSWLVFTTYALDPFSGPQGGPRSQPQA